MGAALILFMLGFGALAAGILIGRYYVPDDRMLRRTAKHAGAYMRTINHLLARNQQEAIDELKSVVSENVEEIEPYFSLGGLFRARGEWERAIRVHQAIELREGSSKRVHQRARYELGLDFRSAGMPRRATRAMEDCLALETKHEGALRALCGLYEEQGRYSEAASAWRRLHRLRGDGPVTREHHLLAAAAQRALAAGDFDSAKRLVRDADKLQPGSAHVFVVAAELAAAKQNYKGASARLEQALEVAPDLAPYLVEGLLEVHRHLVAAALAKAQKKAESPLEAEALEALLSERSAAVVADALAVIADKLGDTSARGGESSHLLLAAADLRSRVEPLRAFADYRAIAAEFPDLLPARVAAGRLALASDDADEIAGELRALVGDDGALAWAVKGTWRCGSCGNRDDVFFWRCKGCRRWGSVRLDVGAAAQELPPPPPRERRELPRRAAADMLLDAERALPEPTLESGLSDHEMAEAGRRESLLGRVSSLISSPFRRR